MTTRKLRWAVVGSGGIGRRTGGDLRLCEDAEVVAIGSRARDTADAFGRAMGLPLAFDNFAQRCVSPEIDAVCSADAVAETSRRAHGRGMKAERPHAAQRRIPVPLSMPISSVAAAFAGLALALFVPTDAQAQGLQSLALQVTGGATLVPAFDPATLKYRSAVQSDIDRLVLDARPAVPGAVLSVSVDGRPADQTTPLQLPLAVGANRVELRLDDAAGRAIGRYEITVERENIRPVVDRFRAHTFTDPVTARAMPYRLYVPDGAGEGRRFPLVVFLHGAGERGEDNETPLTANQGGTVWAKPAEQALRPAYVLVPQARAVWHGGFGVTRNVENKLDLSQVLAPSEDLLTAQRLLRQVLAEHPGIDRRRLYLTGLSQGGFGTWAWNLLEPDLFAAMVPVCGGADPAQVHKLQGKPVWAFHAAADPVVPVDFSRRAIAALRAAGGDPRYTEYDSTTYFFPGAHGSWVPAYRNADLRTWLFSQSR